MMSVSSGAARIHRDLDACGTCRRVGTTRRFGVWPHFFGISWSSIWIACTPAAS